MDLSLLGKEPVSALQPAGVDARYDRQFEEVQAEIDRLSSPSATESIEWGKVVRLSSWILAQQSKDLLVAGYLAVALTKTRGVQGLAVGLRIYGDLLENFWDDLYPSKKRLRGRLRAIAWWLEKTESALKEVEPAPLPPEELQALTADLGRIENFLRNHLDEPPSLQGLFQGLAAIHTLRFDTAAPAEPFEETALDFEYAERVDLDDAMSASSGAGSEAEIPGAGAGPPAADLLEEERRMRGKAPPRPEEPRRKTVPPAAAEAAPPLRGARAPSPAPVMRGAERPAPVEFTVYHPQELHPRSWQTLLVYVHVPEAQPAVEADSRKLLKPEEAFGERRSRATQEIKREAAIVVVPALPGCRFNPPRQTLLWLEDWHRAEFRIQATPDQPGFEPGQAVNGLVSFYVDTVLVGEVKIWALVSDKAEIRPVAPSMQTTSAKPYRAIFVSYAHKDTEIVTRVGRAYEALGMDFLRDQQVLRSGQKWNPQLLSLIERADIFQLYWSEAARASRYVKQEWQYALAQNRDNFVRPVYWKKPLAKPPRRLGELHFAYYPIE